MMATYDQHGQQAQVQYNVAGNLHQQPRPVLLALHQLPPAISDFTGRTAEIARLIDLLTAPTSSSLTSVTILAVSGMGGVGKSALVIYVANQLADRFPDSQLYLNLRGGEGTPLDPSEALASLLGTLGVAADVVPRDSMAAPRSTAPCWPTSGCSCCSTTLTTRCRCSRSFPIIRDAPC